MIQSISTDQDINELGDLAFKCPVCSQVYEIVSDSEWDEIYECEEIECLECGTNLSIDVTTIIKYKVEVNTIGYD